MIATLIVENILHKDLPEIVLSSSDSKVSTQISKLEKAGTLKKIAPRIYTSNFTDTSENLIQRNDFGE